MSVELEAQRQFAVDRTRSIESKAGFLVVAGGLLAAQTLPTLTHGPLQSFAVVLAVTRLVIAFAVTLLAAMALWPLKLKELEPNLRTCVPLQTSSDSSRR